MVIGQKLLKMIIGTFTIEIQRTFGPRGQIQGVSFKKLNVLVTF